MQQCHTLKLKVPYLGQDRGVILISPAAVARVRTVTPRTPFLQRPPLAISLIVLRLAECAHTSPPHLLQLLHRAHTSVLECASPVVPMSATCADAMSFSYQHLSITSQASQNIFGSKQGKQASPGVGL